MAVMPQVGGEGPWKWADKFADNNNTLYKMFYDAQLKKAAQAEQQVQQTGMQDAQFAHARTMQDASQGFQREQAGDRAALTREGWDRQTTRGRLAPDDGTDLLEQYREQFREIEREKGLPEGTLDAFAHVESNSGRNTRARTSSARGPFQFTKDTAKRFNLTNPDDPVASAIATADYAKQNGALFKQRFGREPTGRDLYLMHQQGEGGGQKLLDQPNARAVDVVGMQAVLNNGGSVNMTAAQFADMIQRKYDDADTIWKGKRGGGTRQAAPTGSDIPQSAPSSERQLPAAAATPAATTPTAAGTGTMPSPTGAGDRPKIIKRINPKTGKLEFAPA